MKKAFIFYIRHMVAIGIISFCIFLLESIIFGTKYTILIFVSVGIVNVWSDVISSKILKEHTSVVWWHYVYPLKNWHYIIPLIMTIMFLSVGWFVLRT